MEDFVINNTIRIPSGELQLQFARSSGPGGQNVNKVNSKAILRWSARQSTAFTTEAHQRLLGKLEQRLTGDGDLVISSDEYRDQPKNIARCFDKLKHSILSSLAVPKTRRPTKPSYGSKLRRLDAKRRNSQKKQFRSPGSSQSSE